MFRFVSSSFDILTTILPPMENVLTSLSKKTTALIPLSFRQYTSQFAKELSELPRVINNKLLALFDKSDDSLKKVNKIKSVIFAEMDKVKKFDTGTPDVIVDLIVDYLNLIEEEKCLQELYELAKNAERDFRRYTPAHFTDEHFTVYGCIFLCKFGARISDPNFSTGIIALPNVPHHEFLPSGEVGTYSIVFIPRNLPSDINDDSNDVANHYQMMQRSIPEIVKTILKSRIRITQIFSSTGIKDHPQNDDSLYRDFLACIKAVLGL